MTGIIILAAGSSSRMGRPKQNLLYDHQTLLQHAISTATAVCGQVVVVLGANHEIIIPQITDPKVLIAYNADWQQGMPSSIRCGVQAAQKNWHHLQHVILMPCDQPFLNAVLLNQLVQSYTEHEDIVASTYQGANGIPALFGRSYFNKLLTLQGKGGAKELFTTHRTRLKTIPFPGGEIDIDTPGDYQALLNN